MSIRAALLMNFVAPYRVPLFKAMRRDLRDFKIFLSTAMEPDRPWKPEWADLDVVVQKTLTLPMRLKRVGFRQQLFIHFPYDTLPRLFQYKPDIVISGELGLRSLQAAFYRLLKRRSRLIIWATLSESTEKDWGKIRQALRYWIIRNADGVVVNGASGARYISSFKLPVPIFVMNQPVDVPRFLALSLDRPPEAARRLIYSGRLIGQKGVVEFQTALADWLSKRQDLKVELVWLGNGELRGVLEAAKVPDNLVQRFPGYVAYDELAAAYASCGALVLPSMFDEWGLVVNEAMASGLPVLGSVYSQAVEEMVQDGITGWCFDPKRPDTITAALDAFFSATDEQLAFMRRSARIRASSITPDTAAACMLDAIQAVMPARTRALSMDVAMDRVDT